VKDRAFERACWVLATLFVADMFLEFVVGFRRDEDMPFLRWAPLAIGVFLGAVLACYALMKKRTCPKCGKKLPTWRIPHGRYEWFIGGSTCSGCGTKLTWRLRERK
jgi:hypothetical protein